VFWPALDSVHADRGGRDGAATLPGDDRDCGKGSAFVLQRRVVVDRLIGSALPHENRVLGFHRLIRTGQRRDAEELPEDLAAEHPVIFQLLIPALEYVRIAVSRRCRGDVQTRKQIGPEIGHSPSVSQILVVENLVLSARWRQIRASRSPTVRQR
jgi:hypothetical protein